MSDSSGTYQELLEENAALKQKIQYLETSEALYKRTEKELSFSRQQLRLLIDAGLDFFFLKDINLRYQLVNSANARFFGRDEADILGRTDAELMPEESAVACRESDHLAIREKRIVVTIERVGDKVYETHKFPVLVAGEIIGVAGIIRDITDRKRTEEALQKSEELQNTILSNVGAHIYLKDTQYRYTYVNSKVCNLFGSRADEIVGKDDTSFFSAASVEEILRSDRRVIEHGETITREEIDLTAADKLPRTYWVVKLPLKDSHGNIYGLCGISTDITDRKRAEESMKLNAERTETLLQLNQMTAASLQEITDFVLEKAVQLTRSAIGYLAFLNEDESVLTMHSWSRNAMAECAINHKPIHYPLKNAGLWGEAIRQRKPIITNDYSLPNPWKKGCPDGHVQILRHMNVPVCVESRIALVAGVGNKADDYNVTDVQQLTLLMEGMWHLIERKRVEEALRESEERFRALFESSRDAILMMDPEGRVSYWNPAAEKMFGYTSIESVGRNLHELIAPKRYHEEHRIAYKEFLSTGRGAAMGKTLELQAIRKDGREITVSLSLSAEQIKDGWNAVGILRDITAQKEAEEALKQSESRLSSIIEFLPDATFAIDLEGKIISWNRAIEEMTGFPAEVMLGKGNYEYAMPFYGERRPILVNFLFLWDDDIARKYSYIKKDGDTLYTEADVPFVRGPGRTIWAKASPLRNERGEITGAIESVRDITDRKLLESRLLQAQKMEAVGTLAGGVAHDFNNILMGIQGYVSLMTQELDMHHPHYERLKRIEEQVESASDLTRQLLGFARGGRYEIQSTDMNEIIRKSSAMFGRTKKELTITEKYEKDLWPVEVDRGQIEQVLLNLYVNAWHAMPTGGELFLETKNFAIDESYATLHAVSSGNYVMVCVADTGVGMEEKTKKRIFDPFFTTKEMGRGTGLGLSMVYGIMKGHNGFINVESEPGCGTTFTLYFPASEKKVLEDKPAKPQMLRGSEVILIVDDEPTVLAVSKEILEFLGYTVHSTQSGPEAIVFYEKMKKDIDLVILDMIMPGLSGGETFDRIRELDPSAKVILSSGYSLDGQAQQIMNRGCRGFIQKPFDIAGLSRKLREVLEK